MYIPTDTDCSELNPGMCGGKMQPTMLDNCDTMYFEGVDDVTLNQGVGIDLADGVTAYDSTGVEIPFEYEPTEIDKCSVGEHEVIYKAIGADERLLPSICGENFLSMACSGIGTLIAKRLVTIEQADPPTINGIIRENLAVGELFNPMSGVTGVDDNGNPVDVSYYGEYDDYAEGDIASFETDLTHPFRSLQVKLEPVQNCTPWMSAQDTEPYMFRAVPSQTEDFGHESDTIVGGTVVSHQLATCNVGNFNRNGITVTVPDAVGLKINGTATANDSYQFMSGLQPTPIGHVFLVHGYKKIGNNQGYLGYSGLDIDRGNGGIWKNETTYTGLYMRIDFSTGDTFDNVEITPQYVDLTTYFGSAAIGEYVHSLEQSTPGSGVAWLRKYAPQLFEKHYRSLPSLTSVSGLTSHDMVDFNQWDEDWENGTINTNTGANAVNNAMIRSKNMTPIVPNEEYYIYVPHTSVISGFTVVFFYDADENYLSYQNAVSKGATFTPPTNARYIRFIVSQLYGTTYKNDICINLSDPSLNGTYKPYTKHSYPLDSTLTLRGIPKLGNGRLYYDGDIYESDGTVTRNKVQINLADLDFVAYPVGSDRTAYAVAGAVTTYGVKAVQTAVPNAFCSNGFTPTYQNASRWNAGEFVFTVVGATLPANSIAFITANGAYASAEAFKTAMANYGIIAELATPTTETADPYTNPQIVDPSGTEQYVGSPIPVGHETTYQRICPITGWTGADLTVCGKNLFDKSLPLVAGKYITNTGDIGENSGYSYQDYYTIVNPSTDYIFSGQVGSSAYNSVAFYDENKAFISRYLPPQYGVGAQFTTPNNCHYIRANFANTNVVDKSTVQLEEGTSAKPYTTYNGTTYSVSWQTEAGTVYGGTVDLVTGVLTVTWGEHICDGTDGWINEVSLGTSADGSAYVAYLPKTSNKNMSSQFTPLATTDKFGYTTAGYPHKGEFNTYGSYFRFVLPDDSITTLAQLNTWLSANPLQIVYELATPQTYQLDPVQVQTLLGQNNVWSDSGDVYVEYSKTIPTSGDITYPLDGIYSIIYSATDQCGNHTEETRMIYVGDICAIVDVGTIGGAYLCEDTN